MKTIQKNSGFTLVEIMLSISILSILAAIAVPNMGIWIANFRLKSAVRELANNMQWTKITAIKENRDWIIIFNPPENYLIQSSGNDGKIGTSDDPLPAKNISFIASKSGVGYGKGLATKNATKSGGKIPDDYVSYSGNKLIFNAKGMVNKPGYVYFSNNIGTAYALGTRTLAGLVSIKKWTGNNWE